MGSTIKVPLPLSPRDLTKDPDAAYRRGWHEGMDAALKAVEKLMKDGILKDMADDEHK